jgi:hypothetical protein
VAGCAGLCGLYSCSRLSDCTASQCEVTFAATTDAKTVITAVSCIFALPPGASVVQSAFGPDDSVKFFVQPFLDGFSNLTGFNTYGINAQVNLFIKKGTYPPSLLSRAAETSAASNVR